MDEGTEDGRDIIERYQDTIEGGPHLTAEVTLNSQKDRAGDDEYLSDVQIIETSQLKPDEKE